MRLGVCVLFLGAVRGPTPRLRRFCRPRPNDSQRPHCGSCDSVGGTIRPKAGLRYNTPLAPSQPSPLMSPDSGSKTQAAAQTFRTTDHVWVASLWFAYNVQWGALLPIGIPAQIAEVVGFAKKELYNGALGFIGALVALVIAPLAGFISDRSKSSRGRRRPHLIAGCTVNSVSLLLMGCVTEGSSIIRLIGFLIAVQFGANWWGGPYAGLIPDLVPLRERGRASGYMMAMTALGTLVGALVGGGLVHRASYLTAYTAVSAIIMLCLIATLIKVREPIAQIPDDASDVKPSLRLLPSVRLHPDYYWVLLTRALVMMGMFALYTFFQYFLADVVHVDQPVQTTSVLLGTMTLVGIPISLIAGQLSDRIGRKQIVLWTGVSMAGCSFVYAILAVAPSWEATLALAVVFGAANCAYQAVDWALAIDVLPAASTSARDMGIWHSAIVLPQMISPAVSGLVLTLMKPLSLSAGYVALFLLAGIWFLVGSCLITRVRCVR